MDQHVVSFGLAVQETFFVSELSDKVAAQTRLGTALTMMLSALGIMRVAKTFMQRSLDSCLKNKTEVPKDVKRRLILLQEKFITKPAVRSSTMSSSSANHMRVKTRRLSEIGGAATGVEMTEMTISAASPSEPAMWQQQAEALQKQVDRLQRQVDCLLADHTNKEVSQSKKVRAGGDGGDHNRTGTFLPPGWKRHKDNHGRKYYEDVASMQTQWEKPPGNDADKVAVAMVKNPMAGSKKNCNNGV